MPLLAVPSLKLFLEDKATSRVLSLIDAASLSGIERQSDEYIIELARVYHKKYLEKNDENIWRRLYPYRFILTNTVLPDFMRLENGTIENLSIGGQCDSIARALAFGLRVSGFEAAQFNMVNTSSTGHSIVQITLNENRKVVIYPMYGVYPYSNGHLISAKKAWELSTSVEASRRIWKPLSENFELGFYEDFGSVVFQNQDGIIPIDSVIDLHDRERIIIGDADGKSSDLESKIGLSVLNSYWTYLGHRYDRMFVRSMEFNRPAKVTFLAVEAIDKKFLTAENHFVVNGNSLAFELKKNEKLIFVDGEAKRDWLKLKSFQLLDQIIIESCQTSCS